jgi:hypothetical protein
MACPYASASDGKCPIQKEFFYAGIPEDKLDEHLDRLK